MKPPRFRMNLRQLMLGVAWLSLIFAMIGVAGGMNVTLLLALFAWPLASETRSKRIEGWALSASLFPFLVLFSIASTWLAARLSLGHAPNALDFRKAYPGPLIVGARITADFFVLLLPVSILCCSFLTVAAAKRRAWADSELTVRQNAMQSAVGPALWILGFGILTLDPLRMIKSVLG